MLNASVQYRSGTGIMVSLVDNVLHSPVGHTMSTHKDATSHPSISASVDTKPVVKASLPAVREIRPPSMCTKHKKANAREN